MIQSPFLIRVLTESYLKDGCGMTIKPSFYSGRGARLSDLSSQALERIYQALKTNASIEAAESFAEMVAAIPVLSATAFLLALEHFEEKDWRWEQTFLDQQSSVHITDYGSAFGTLAEAFGGERPDDTVQIRATFLRARRIKDPLSTVRSDYEHFAFTHDVMRRRSGGR